MADAVNAVAGSTVRPEWAVPSDQTGPTNELGKDEFLQLLVAQLKYQDPLEPTSSDEFISTTAQFTVVEKLDELTRQGANSALVTSLTTAGNLVGREVTANRDGVEVTAVVQRSRIVSGSVVLDTVEGEIALNQIVSIGSPTAPAGPAEVVAAGDGVATILEPGAATTITPRPAASDGAVLGPDDDTPDDLVDAFLDEETAAAAGYGPDADPVPVADGSLEYVDGVGFVEVVGGEQSFDSQPGIPVVQQLEPVQVIQPVVFVGVPETTMSGDETSLQSQVIGPITSETVAALAPDRSEPDRLDETTRPVDSEPAADGAAVEPAPVATAVPDGTDPVSALAGAAAPTVRSRLNDDEIDEEHDRSTGSDPTVEASAATEPTG